MDLDFLKPFAIKTPCSINQLHGEHIWLVESAEGQYILKKINKKFWGLEKLLEEHRLLEYLSSSGVPVACPVKVNSADTYFEREDSIYVLMPKLMNNPMDFFSPQSRRMYVAIGRAIAALHKALAVYPCPINSFTIDPYRVLYQDIIPELQEYTEEQEGHRVVQLLSVLQDEMRDAFENLPRQRIHGDCHTGNVCVSGDLVTGFIDCDHLPMGPRLFDLGEYLIHIIKWDVENIEKTNAFFSLYPALIEGYHALNPLTERELRSLWHMFLYIQLAFYHWKMKNGRSDAAPDLKAFWWVYSNRNGFDVTT